jgi:hypothetical protein
LGTQGAEGGNRPLSVSALLAALQVIPADQNSAEKSRSRHHAARLDQASQPTARIAVSAQPQRDIDGNAALIARNKQPGDVPPGVSRPRRLSKRFA